MYKPNRYTDVLDKAKSERKTIKKKFRQLARANKKDLDQQFHTAHEDVFQEIDCLDCANCCKTTSPIFRSVDIDRISRKLGQKPGDFIEQFLRIDEDQDYVLQQSPCTFLGADNKCSIYEFRPLACREYPHTNRKNMFQILDMTERNTRVCPAVAAMLERITIG